MRRIGLNLKEIRLIRAERRDTPGNMLMKPNQDDWTTWHSNTSRIPLWALDVVLVEQRWIANWRLWVAN